MFQDDVPANDVPASSRAPDQVWFSMIMVNDPNAALFGALRPSRPHPILAALRRPFERDPLAAPRPVSEASEAEPASHPRWSRWLGVGLLLLGVAGAEGLLEAVTSRDSPQAAGVARVGATMLIAPSARQTAGVEPAASGRTDGSKATAAPAGVASAARVAPSPITVSAALRPSEAGARTSAAGARAASASVRATTSVKKKTAARQRQRAFGRALASRTNTRG